MYPRADLHLFFLEGQHFGLALTYVSWILRYIYQVPKYIYYVLDYVAHLFRCDQGSKPVLGIFGASQGPSQTNHSHAEKPWECTGIVGVTQDFFQSE